MRRKGRCVSQPPPWLWGCGGHHYKERGIEAKMRGRTMVLLWLCSSTFHQGAERMADWWSTMTVEQIKDRSTNGNEQRMAKPLETARHLIQKPTPKKNQTDGFQTARVFSAPCGDRCLYRHARKQCTKVLFSFSNRQHTEWYGRVSLSRKGARTRCARQQKWQKVRTLRL